MIEFERGGALSFPPPTDGLVIVGFLNAGICFALPIDPPGPTLLGFRLEEPGAIVNCKACFSCLLVFSSSSSHLALLVEGIFIDWDRLEIGVFFLFGGGSLKANPLLWISPSSSYSKTCPSDTTRPLAMGDFRFLAVFAGTVGTAGPGSSRSSYK